MTEWKPTAAHVSAAYANFRAPWDFRKRGSLRLPLHRPMTVLEEFEQVGDACPTPQKMWQAVISEEHGWMDGRRTVRIVGRVPETDIEVVLEIGTLDQRPQR